MDSILPQFPLRIVVFPKERLNLHIFEPRYKQLINECLQKKRHFGIPAYINGSISKIGTELELLSVEKVYANGEMDITTKGIGIYKIIEFYEVVPDKPYPGATVENLEIDYKVDTSINEQMWLLIEELFKVLGLEKRLPNDPGNFDVFEIAHFIGLSLEQEYELLTLCKCSDRMYYVKTHLESLLPKAIEIENIRKKAQMNGHFNHLIPPL